VVNEQDEVVGIILDADRFACIADTDDGRRARSGLSPASVAICSREAFIGDPAMTPFHGSMLLRAMEIAPPQHGTTRIRTFENPTGTMSMAHPLHVHGPQFQIVERRSENVDAAAYATVREGFVDDGWKDTVLLMSGERVRLRIRFEHHAGVFLYHCHNLEHEDMA
jgi:hypothetical protein